MNLKIFYDRHLNFSKRTEIDYFISPGIKSKFDLIIDRLKNVEKFNIGIDLGCSGDSILSFINNFTYKCFLDIASDPLNQFNINYKHRKSKLNKQNQFPVCGDIQQLPYRDNLFEVVFALDVLEHVKNDEACVSEISRILKKYGYAIVSIPHRKKFYTTQDKLIGHYRRYEIDEIKGLFLNYNLKCIEYFGIYGILMKISLLQAIKPDFVTDNIQKLRLKYLSGSKFRIFWKILVYLLSKLMIIDAKYTPKRNIMNIAFIFRKI